MSIRCYSELIQLPTFMDRYQYLRLDGVVGEETFGFDRYMNQAFYKSPKWRQVRDAVIPDHHHPRNSSGHSLRR